MDTVVCLMLELACDSFRKSHFARRESWRATWVNKLKKRKELN